jgi:4-alpha-glucanotransferase
MLTQRASGILLHPTCFPSSFGVGDLGYEAERFLDWIAGAGQQYWQVLPLVPTDVGDSPYQSPSAFAGNPLLISPERLRDDGLLTEGELQEAEVSGALTAARVDFSVAIPRKQRLLTQAFEHFRRLPSGHGLRGEFDRFCHDETSWLPAHAMFMALREANGGRSWLEWTEYVTEHSRPSSDAAHLLADRCEFFCFQQFLFFRQWQLLRRKARDRGIRLIGDVPIYVSHDSVEVWANREQFQLDAAGRPTRVAGVPPDYFCAEGQLWNNPLFDWDAVRRDGYRWWIRRMQAARKVVDLVRLDHFRGFEAYWSVPAGETTAIHGEWVPGPCDEFLAAMRDGLRVEQAQLPIIAEDLGMITEPVHELRRRFDLPGMKVLQFRLPGDPWEPPFKLDEFEPNSVVYTGTHDNDTTSHWFQSEIAPQPQKLEQLRKYTPCDPQRIAWEFVEIAWKSTSLLAMVPLQDLFELGGDARMNTPGTSGPDVGNWRWKYQPGLLTPDVQERLKYLTLATGRAQ